MNKTLQVTLNSKSIENTIEILKMIQNNMDNLASDIIEEAVKDSVDHLDKLYNERTLDEKPNVSYSKTNNGWKITAVGQDVLYEEFGTGEVGKDSANNDAEFNTERQTYGLKDYNTGEFVKNHINKNGRHYWFHKGPGMMFDNGYTEGIPAGKQVFNTRKYLIESAIPNAEKKVMGDFYRNIDNTINK